MFNTRGAILLALTWAVILALAAAITLAALRTTDPPAPPLTYSAPRYAALDPVVCPGEALRWPVRLTVDAAPDRPVVSAIVRSIWSFDRQRTVRTDDAPEYSILMESTTISATVSYTVPLDLPAGAYEVRTGRLTEARDVRGYAVAFAVPAGCR